MKKILSLVIAFMMISTTALANTIDGFSEVWKNFNELKSYSGQTTMSVTVNEPMLFLEDIPLDDEGIDYSLMINDLLKSTATADFSVNISQDFKKMQMAMSVAYDVPVSMNEDFKLDAWARVGMWLDYDMTNPEAPVYKTIVKTPFDSKYQVMDVGADLGADMTSILTPETVKGISDATLEVIKENGNITRTSKGYRVNFDNAGMFGYMLDMMNEAKVFATDDVDIEAFDEVISAMEWAKDNLTILGDDGMTLEFTKNAQGDINATVETMHFDFNIYDIATFMEVDTEGLARERANVDITLKAESKISGHNKTVVEMPVLTEENSEDINGGSSDVYFYEAGSPLFANNATYYSIDEIMTSAGLDFAPQYSEGVLTLTNEDGHIITVKGNVIAMNGDEWNMEKPQMTEKDGIIYLTEDVLGLLYIDPYANYDTVSKAFTYSFWHDQSITYPYVETSFDEDTEPYIPPYLYEYVSSDQVPYVEDGEAFIPVYDLLKNMYAGDFVITADSLRYTATGKNRYDIGEVFVKVGENSIMVDNEYITFEKPVVNVANIFRAPLEFVENIGFTVEDIYMFDDHTQYELSMPNPEFWVE